MTLLKKIYGSLAFRCFTALALGLGIVTLIAVELASLAFDGAMLPPHKTAEAVLIDTPFPENEDMLRDMAARMGHGRDVSAQALNAANAPALNAIETAAGE